MSADPYAILGVAKTATQDEVQKAFRALAKKLHPDLNPGNDKAEAQFKEVTRAYDLLSDPAKRARFDAGEIDEQGAERPQERYYRDFADHADNPYANASGFSDFDPSEDIFSGIFGRAAGSGRGNARHRGANLHFHLAVDFLDAVNGARKQIGLPDGASLEVTLPPGIRDGQSIRLRGKGEPGLGGGPAGDALIEIEVLPHRLFTRDGDDIRIELPITLHQAVLGGQIRVPTPSGDVTMTVPPWTNSGASLRLKGKGVAASDGKRGDEFVKLTIRLPDKPDPKLKKLMSEWLSASAERKAAES